MVGGIGTSALRTMLEWLLGLDRIRLDADAPISLRFATAPAAWIMLFGAVLAAALVYRAYRSRRVPSRWRWGMMVLRFGAIMTVLFVLGRPMLSLQRNEVEPSVVVVMLDSSGSMSATDVDGERDRRSVRGDGGTIDPGEWAALESMGPTRWHAAMRSLFHSADGLIPLLLDRHEVELWTFDAAARRIGTARQAEDCDGLFARLGDVEPSVGATDAASSLMSVFDALRGRRLAGVVVVSDGRQTAFGGVDSAARQAASQSVAIHAGVVGSPRARSDVEMTEVRAAEDVFLRDTVRIHGRMEFRGLREQTEIAVELRERQSGTLLARRTELIRADESVRRFDLVYRPTEAGRRLLTVRAMPLPEEDNTANNALDLAIRAHDEKIAVLYVEGDPRYEYRFLKNLLLREETIDSSCLLLSATPGFAQEGTRPISRFPRSVEELNNYDVVIIGDVDPRGDWISPVQTSMLFDFVSIQGGGVAFIAGERHVPQRMARTKLEPLLPVRPAVGLAAAHVGDLVEAFEPRLTVEGRDHAAFLTEAGDAADVIASMPGWYWYAQVAAPSPGAVVLAEHPTAQAGAAAMPLIVLGRYGAGRTLYIGSDDLWRWRQYSGEAYYSHVWLQMIRTLARGKRFGEQDGWRIETDRKRYELGREVRVELTAGLAGATVLPPEPTIVITDEQGHPIRRVALRRQASDSHRAHGEFTADRVGRFSIVADAALVPAGKRAVSTAISVAAVDRERERPEADEDFMIALAESTGGQFARVGNDWRPVIGAIPDRSMQIPADIEESIWDSRLVLLLFTTLIVAEWIMRKWIGLT